MVASDLLELSHLSCIVLVISGPPVISYSCAILLALEIIYQIIMLFWSKIKKHTKLSRDEKIEEQLKILNDLDDKEFKQMIMDKLGCEICFENTNSLKCSVCWKGFCSDCHDLIVKQSQKLLLKGMCCPWCRSSNAEFQLINLPRM